MFKMKYKNKLAFWFNQLSLAFAVALIACFLITFLYNMDRCIIPFESIQWIRGIEIFLSFIAIPTLIIDFFLNFHYWSRR